MFVMQHKCTKDSPPMYNGCTTDAPWMHRGCTMDAPRMNVGRTTDAVWMHYGCTTNSFTCTTDAQGKPHRCTTDALWTHYGCTRNAPCMLYGCASEYFLDVPWLLYGYPRAPHRYVFTMDVPCIQYTCTAYSEAGSLSLDNLVYLFICLC